MTRFGADDTLDLGADVLVSAAGRAVDADSRRQMREDGAAVLSKVANSKPVTAANEKFNKLLDFIEANVDKDKIQQQVQRYIDAAQAMANDANFRAGFDETPYGPRHAPPAAKEDFLPDQLIKELTAKADTVEKKPEIAKTSAESTSSNKKGGPISKKEIEKYEKKSGTNFSSIPKAKTAFAETLGLDTRNLVREFADLDIKKGRTLPNESNALKSSRDISNQVRKKMNVRNRR